MKFLCGEEYVCPGTSLPVRGAWIEMRLRWTTLYKDKKSLPVRGAWIEMAFPTIILPGATVAPRAGSVD